MPEDYNENPLPEDKNPDRKGNQDENIPDWMKEAGWETSSGTFDESKPVFDDLDDDEEEIVPADIPSWLEEVAPEGYNFESEAADNQGDESESDQEPFVLDDFDFGEPSQTPPSPEPSHEPELQPNLDTEQTPEDLPFPEGDKIDVPSWLENLELDEDSQETAVAWLENMPESLRATEEELKAAEEFPAPEPESIEEFQDELDWMDNLSADTSPAEASEQAEEAALSEDLVASELIPESSDQEQIFKQEEISTFENEMPAWLEELGEEKQPTTSSIPDEEGQELQEEPSVVPDVEMEEPQPGISSADDGEESKSMLPDWLSDLETPDEPDQQEPETPSAQASQPVSPSSEDLPGWLGDLSEGDAPAIPADESADTLQWLGSLSGGDSPEQVSPPESDGQAIPEFEDIEPADQQADDEVSPNDDTLNTQIPSWLSQISDIEDEEVPAAEQAQKTDLPADAEPADSSSWLEQIGEDVSPEADSSAASSEREVLDWLDAMETAEAAPDQAGALDDLRESLEVEEPSQDLEQMGLETAKYLSEDYQEPESTEEAPDAAPERSEKAEDDSLPDWLSELSSVEDEEPLSLEDAIRKSDQPLSEEEQEFLSKSEKREADNSEWLSKLDQEQDQEITLQETEFELEIEVEPETRPEIEPEQASDGESQIPGGMLERLNENDQEDQELEEAEIPEWLEDLKTEEEPQETAVLWLQEFIEKGERANVHDEIKRYTDELDPGDSIPKWMEDLKNEEDPQTTAMLWLEKFSDNRETPPSSAQAAEQDDTSDWLAELEREEADEVEEAPQPEPSSFDNPDEGWLADLDIDEKLKATTSDRDEFLSSKDEHQQKPDNEEEPSWMKATSPLEGDIYTDELAGEQKEVEIPAWLAGYGEGEGPEESESAEKPSAEEPIIDQGSQQSPSEEDEYTWVAAEGSLKATRKPIDLNKAAISQLESILGISYQVAKGIVHFREKQGPYRQFSDLMNVPEIVDEQTIEILKPEVFIGMVEEPAPEFVQKPAEKPKAEPETEPKPSPPKKQKSGQAYDEILETARARLDDADLQAAADNYGKLIKKKKFLEEIISDLQQATLDHPLEINLQKILGDAYMKSDMLDEALEAYSKAEDLLS